MPQVSSGKQEQSIDFKKVGGDVCELETKGLFEFISLVFSNHGIKV